MTATKMFFMILMIVCSSFQGIADDTIPWPFAWGAECSIYWADFSGVWEMKDGDKSYYLELSITDENLDGGKIVQAVQYDESMTILGYGHGFVATNEKLIRMILVGKNHKGQGVQSWLVLRSYYAGNKLGKKRKNLSNEQLCQSGKVAMTLTMQPFDLSNKKLWKNFYLKRMDKSLLSQ